MLRSVLGVCLLAYLASTVAGEGRVCEGDIVINKIEDIAPWADCEVVTGSFQLFNSTGVQQVAAFTQLKRIQQNLYIWSNHQLLTLAGLASLEFVGGNVDVLANPLLTSLEGFASLKEIKGHLMIWDNPILGSLEGMKSIEKIHGTISILFNPFLVTLDGFLPASYQTIHNGLILKGNHVLESLNGLEPIQLVKGSLELRQNTVLTDLNGLRNLKEIRDGKLIIQDCLKLEDFRPLLALQRITPHVGEETQPGVDLQHMPEVRCLPQFVLAKADTHAWYNPRGQLRTCEVLIERFKEAGIEMDLEKVLTQLGLQANYPHFQRQHLHVEHFLDLFQDPNHPLSQTSPMTEHLWPHLIWDTKEKEKFQAWIEEQNAALAKKFGGRIPLLQQEVLADPKEKLRQQEIPGMERYGYQDDLERIEREQAQKHQQQHQQHQQPEGHQTTQKSATTHDEL